MNLLRRVALGLVVLIAASTVALPVAAAGDAGDVTVDLTHGPYSAAARDWPVRTVTVSGDLRPGLPFTVALLGARGVTLWSGTTRFVAPRTTLAVADDVFVRQVEATSVQQNVPDPPPPTTTPTTPTTRPVTPPPNPTSTSTSTTRVVDPVSPNDPTGTTVTTATTSPTSPTATTSTSLPEPPVVRANDEIRVLRPGEKLVLAVDFADCSGPVEVFVDGDPVDAEVLRSLNRVEVDTVGLSVGQHEVVVTCGGEELLRERFLTVAPSGIFPSNGGPVVIVLLLLIVFSYALRTPVSLDLRDQR